MDKKLLHTFIKQDNRSYNNFYKLYYSIEEINTKIYDKYYNKEFYLLSDRIDGFGGRTMSLFSLMYFATIFKNHTNSNKIPIILHWIRNDGMGCNFFELFDSIENETLSLIEDTNPHNKWRTLHDKYHPSYPRIYRQIQDLDYYKNKKAVHNAKQIDSIYNITNSKNIKIWENGVNFYANAYVKINDVIQKRGNDLLKEINRDRLIGIHIRTSDLHKLNLQYYVDFIRTYNLEQYTFIVASQDNEDIDYFEKAFPNTKFIKQFVPINSIKDKTKHQLYYNLAYFDNKTRKEIMYTDTLDYYLLSLCKVIITNSRNSNVNNKEISSYIKSLLLYNNNLAISLYKGSDCKTFCNIIADKLNKALE